MITIAIADNDRFALEMLARTVGRALPGSQLLWTTTTGERAVHHCLYETAPDVLLLDMSLGGTPDGIEACRMIRQHAARPAIVAITSYSPAHYQPLAIDAGAQGLISKAATPKALVEAIRVIASGGVMPGFMDAATAHDALAATEARLAPLSAQEREVLRLYADRLTTQEIAEQLGIKASTVFVVMRHAKVKLGVNTRAEAIRAFLGLN
ncbi:two-component response regulator [Bifidobacterium goeldii]|uniref:Two-component response regulator n=1 Tax=Bifidobacterium goeldii TaxID=2306975 RepID=A0A430FK11_9BIFI|nr:response regulator transcription factor [Bifidobacterium goeldii]RSX53166.1 two-component response regulator [Bifidobacterium goeldii]